MRTTTFTPLRELIIVEAKIWGPRGELELDLVLDTGSMHTVILPDIMDDLGFNPRDALAITDVYSAVGKEQGYMIKVPRFEALGFTRTDFPIHVFDLADRYGIDGLIGLSFLHHYDYTVRSAAGQILAEELAAELLP
ncbi:MAG TPA: retropepsin-like aspartic protease [Kofleriaceae bacterium]|nr:retropepsin-like aspartic protease [Kofleriaceae bacterium]